MGGATRIELSREDADLGLERSLLLLQLGELAAAQLRDGRVALGDRRVALGDRLLGEGEGAREGRDLDDAGEALGDQK